ncbi:peptidoglycan amidohydrolase family protein [uncultured Apibacter sp.]|uniref:peptidoglycan amidohydrolase family protein n=1 Tax=uncultured Apibacter sp. TaxID=1778616 RepID=UPI0025FCAE46|nr:peptidoglycan amidohydrolase family protein [uncultured Apibacter sp.]
MTPEEAALTGMIDWFKDGMYLEADQTGKMPDDQVVDSIIKIINKKTLSYPERRVWYRGGKAGNLTVSESNSTKSIFRVEECGKVDEPLKYENSDLKIQEGIKWLLSKCIDQTEVNKKPYKVTYKNDDDRISEKGENTMDCSELVCRYLQKIEWSKKVMGGNTRILYEFAEKYPIYLQKHDDLDYKPQIGDIFIWKSSSGMGHTGVIIDYEEIPNEKGIDKVVTTVEAISSSEIPYGMEKKLTMGGVIKLKWKKDSYHLLDHKVTAQRSPCRFYTPLIHYSKADKKVNWNKNNYSFEIIKK